MVGKINTGETTIEFETSFPKDRAWKIYRFIQGLANEDVSPKESFERAFK